MKTKDGNAFSKNGKSIGLHILIEKYVNIIQLYSKENIEDIDKSVHEIRKSLKSILAILLLYKTPSDLSQYLQWKPHFRSILKQFALSRESYVFLQTLCHIEVELKELDTSYFTELRNDLESNYNLLVKENENLRLKIKELNGTINDQSKAVNNSFRNCNFKILKDNNKYTFQMTQRLYKGLKLSSSSDDYHKFRKWCIFFHFQQTALYSIGFEKISPKNDHKFHKLTEYLGNEHDLQIFHEYLKTNFSDLSEKLGPFFLLKINRLREKVLLLYPKIFI
jgi:hypothetical protein